MHLAQRPLTAGWVAGSARARQLLGRRLGRDRARELAGCRSLRDALGSLAGTAYAGTVRAEIDLSDAQRGVAATALWHLRILAGWAPPRAVEPVRTLASWFELANIEDRLAYVGGAQTHPPFRPGGLETAWSRVAGAQTVADVRAGLAGTAWGDPGAEDPAGIALALRMSWARRVLGAVEEATEWAAGAVALLLAREMFLAGRPAGQLAAHQPPGVGVRWQAASSVAGLPGLLPPHAAWALADVEDPARLSQAEAGWWHRVEADAETLTHHALLGRPVVVGSVVLLCVDAWRAAGALEVAARGGGAQAMEVFDEIA